MRKSPVFIILILFTLPAGIGGFLLRRHQLNTAFEPLTGLAITDAPVTIQLIALTMLFMLIIALFAIYISIKYKSPDGFDKSFGTHSLLYPLVLIPLAIVWNCGTFLHILNIRAVTPLIGIDYAYAALSIIASLSIVFFAIEIYQNPRSKAAKVMSLLPIVFLCFRLIILYRENAANPVMLDYVFQALALATATLGFYYTGGYLFDKPAPGKAVISYCGAIYFCAVSLADDNGLGESLIYFVLLAVSAIYLWMLLRHIVRKRPSTEA